MLRVLLAIVLALVPLRSFAAWEPPGVDLTRPRLLMRAGDVTTVQQRVERDPYRRVIVRMMNRTRLADNVALDDHAIGSERNKARAAKNLAFLYAIDRTLIDGAVVPFPSTAERAAVGERVRALLLNMYTRSRLAVAPPLGNWDRDINTSEELLQYATAYDTMLGAGFELGADADVIAGHIADLASELYDNYVHPETANNYATVHQNNHRSKTGAALVMAGIALAEYSAAPGSDPRGIRDPSKWIEYGLDLIDLILRYALVTGDGAYAEGPFYLRYTAQNVLPFARAWDRLVGREWEAFGQRIPNFWRHPLFLRSQRWLLDMTLPDGSLAPIDDGNVGRSYYFGAAPFTPDTEAAFAWRWANAPDEYEGDGSVDLAADAIVNYDDAVEPAPPTSSPTAFYIEGGNAIFRSDWSPDAVHALVLGEHDTASEFGRDRDGRGVAPESHEHADPGSFIFSAFGETLALDPGYLDFGGREAVNQPRHHNLILVEDKGPIDYLVASLNWLNGNLSARPPADGHATLSDAVDGNWLDAVRVTSRYGQPASRAALFNRRFVFVDNRYLVATDEVVGPTDPGATYTWLLHGNGGGDSGGTFELLSNGGRWTRPNARLDSTIIFDRPAELETAEAVHEAAGRQQQTHTVLKAHATGRSVRATQLLYPTRSEESPPTVTILDGGTTLMLEDIVGDRRIVSRTTITDGFIFPGKVESIGTDGAFMLADLHLDGRLRAAWVEPATTFSYDSRIGVTSSEPGAIGIRVADDEVEVVVTPASATMRVYGLPFFPASIDGACAFVESGGIVVRPPRNTHFVLKRERGTSKAFAGVIAPERVAVGSVVTLDAYASCLNDGTAPPSPRWEMISAPAGSSWTISEADPWMPTFVAERPGPYRIRLTLTDGAGVTSEPADTLVIAGERCADGIDDDLDGLFDSDDPDCDATRTLPSMACTADCTDRGVVNVANLVSCVSIALDRARLRSCAACDGNGDNNVAVNELVTGVNNLLRGCSS